MDVSYPPITDTLKILIAEDHELARSGLAYSISVNSAFKIIGEVETGAQAIVMAQEVQPDVILMDIGMPVMDGIEATQLIKKQFPAIKIVILTSHTDNNQVLASLASGADAYCLKEIKTQRLIQVIEMVMEGAVWLDPNIAHVVINTLSAVQNQSLDTTVIKRKQTDLTTRELEVLEQIVLGKSNKDIAETLQVTIHTVKAHVCNIIQKLAVDDRTQAAVKALKEGFISSVSA